MKSIKYRVKVFSNRPITYPQAFYQSIFAGFDDWHFVKVIGTDDYQGVLAETDVIQVEEELIESKFDSITPHLYHPHHRAYVDVTNF